MSSHNDSLPYEAALSAAVSPTCSHDKVSWRNISKHWQLSNTSALIRSSQFVMFDGDFNTSTHANLLTLWPRSDSKTRQIDSSVAESWEVGQTKKRQRSGVWTVIYLTYCSYSYYYQYKELIKICRKRSNLSSFMVFKGRQQDWP